MLLAVSVVSAHIAETHERWRLEAMLREGQTERAVDDPRFPVEQSTELPPTYWQKEGFRMLGDDPLDFGPVFEDASRFGGLMYVVDLETGEEVWRSDWGDLVATPSGFCFDGDCMYVADLEGSNIFEVDMRHEPGRLLRRISHPALNDTHYVVRTRRGLLVTSTGTDMVIEMDLNGNSLYQWWAGDFGFTTTIGGFHRLPEKTRDHRDQYYHTRYQTTHVNAAQYRDADETRLLALLWEQGALVEIDTTLPAERQQPRVVLDGLSHPHSIRSLPDGGWMVADSQGEGLVVLDCDLQLRRRVPSVTGWIQDAQYLGENRWVIADVNRFRLLIQDDMGNAVKEIPFDRDWRVYGVNLVPQYLEETFLHLERTGGKKEDQ